MTKLALIRHGHTVWNRMGQIQGRTDIPLDAEAIAGLTNLALPVEWQNADLVSSPLQRAAQTAELIARRKPQTIAALTEMDWGDWEGKKGIDLKADPTSGFRDIEDWGWDYRPQNGESPAEVRTRLQGWLDTLQQDTVAVCHIGIMRVLLAMATGWGFQGPAPFRVKRNRLFVIDINSDGLFLNGDPIRLIER